MRYRKTVPAAVLALLAAAACDRQDSPVTPQAGTPSAPTAPTRIPSTDDELARVAREEIPGFAGYYLQNDGTPVVRLVEGSQSAAAQAYVEQHLGVARASHSPLAALKARTLPLVLPAAYDFAQLKEWADQLTPLLQQRGDVYLVDVDEVNNRVLLGVGNTAGADAVRAAAQRLGIPAEAVATQTQAAPQTRATVRDRFTTFVGGIQIAFGQYLCTAGFNAKRVSNGANIFVTNSHCTTTQYASDGVAEYQNTVASGNQVGNEVADRALYACATGYTACRRSDAVFISHNGTRTIGQGGIIRTNWNTGAAGGLTTIGEFDIIGRYTGTLPVGSYLDKTGRTSGSTYGQVTNSCVTIGSLICQDISKVWSEPGDSGSPVYVYIGGSGTAENDVQLHGVMWGGPGSDYTTTYSSRLSGIEADLGALNTLCRPGYGC
ncbi:MAG TPA: hypothetical protein VFJ82_26170 [Longimicrobium sp.]|nr:hypothetical protein [Longimicrobium sp.]